MGNSDWRVFQFQPCLAPSNEAVALGLISMCHGCHGHGSGGTGWILASARGRTRQGHLRRLGKSHFSHRQIYAGATVPWKSMEGKGADPHKIPKKAIVFSPGWLEQWSLELKNIRISIRIPVIFCTRAIIFAIIFKLADFDGLCVFSLFFGQPGRTKIWFGTIPLHERWQPGHLFLKPIHPIIPSTDSHLFHVMSLTQSIPKLAIWDS